MPSLIGAVNLSGERFPLFDRALVPQSAGIPQGYVLVATNVPPATGGQADSLACDLPNAANVLSGGRLFLGVNQSAGTTTSTDNQIDAAQYGVAKSALKANLACVAGQECGYDPADGGTVQPVTSTNQGVLVVIGRFTQSRAASASIQLVGVLLHAEGIGGDRLLGAIVASSTAVSNTASETAFDQSVAIPAGRIQGVGTVLKVRAKVRITSGNASDTLQLKVRLDTTAGMLLGQTPAVNVTDAGGDLGVLDLVATIRAVGASGTMVVDGIAGISPGQAVATGGNVQTTGTAGTIAIDTTAAHNVVVTATWSNASSSNSCVLEDLVLFIS